MIWRRTREGEASPLGLTVPKPHQGVIGMQLFPRAGGREYPACSQHGAMNRVSAVAHMWRCLNCNIGAEYHELGRAL